MVSINPETPGLSLAVRRDGTILLSIGATVAPLNHKCSVPENIAPPEECKVTFDTWDGAEGVSFSTGCPKCIAEEVGVEKAGKNLCFHGTKSRRYCYEM